MGRPITKKAFESFTLTSAWIPGAPAPSNNSAQIVRQVSNSRYLVTDGTYSGVISLTSGPGPLNCSGFGFISVVPTKGNVGYLRNIESNLVRTFDDNVYTWFNGSNSEAEATINPIMKIIVPNGLVAYWLFNPTSFNWKTKQVHDLSGNDNTGSLSFIPPTALVSGLNSPALTFNGSSSCITVPNSTSINLNGSFSIAFWLDPYAWNNGGSSGILSKKLDPGSGFVIYDDGSTECGGACGPLMNLRIQDNDSNSYPYLYSSSYVIVGVWQHWTVTYSATSQTLSWYLNGNVDNTFSSIIIGDTTNDLSMIMGLSQNWTGYLNGMMNDIRIYDRCLLGSEVGMIYRAKL